MSTADRPTLAQLEQAAPFEVRHIGPDADAQAKMLAVLGYGSLEDLTAAAVPEAIRALEGLDLPAAGSEPEVLAELRALADRNHVTVPMIGLGYSGTHTPPVVLRNVMENPAWYTAYTPYQPEISQGRLEALLNFQTVLTDLTGLPIAGSSLLDEATAAAEAMTLARRSSKAPADAAFLVDADCLPQTIAVVQTRAEPLGLRVAVVDLSGGMPDDVAVFGVLLQYPGAGGAVRDLRPVIEQAHEQGAVVAVAATCSRSPCSPRRRAGRRRRRRQQPALRRPARVRRPARRLHGRPQGARADDARPAGRRERRRRRRARLPAGPADPRAAHPPREGDEQHLHRAGAARRHGRHVRRLPRRRGACATSRAHPATPRCSPRRCAPRRRRRARQPSSTPCSSRVPGGRTPSWPPRTTPASRCAVSTPTPSAISTDETTTRAHLDAVVAAFGGGRPGLGRLDAAPRRAARPTWRAPRRTCCTRSSPTTAARRRCCATCAGSSTRTSRWTAP
jgi:hypothetical protein